MMTSFKLEETRNVKTLCLPDTPSELARKSARARAPGRSADDTLQAERNSKRCVFLMFHPSLRATGEFEAVKYP